MDFQICGTLYHFTGPLQAAPGAIPRYAQLYFYDPETAANYRFDLNQSLTRDILTEITGFLHSENPHVQRYQTAQERIQEAAVHSRTVQVRLNPRMEVVVQEGADLRRENLPVANEVAAIIPNVAENDRWRDIIFYEVTQYGHSVTYSATRMGAR